MAVRPLITIEPDDAANLLGGGLVSTNVGQMARLRPHGAPRVVDMIHDGRLVYSKLDPNEQWQTYEQIVKRLATEGAPVDGDCEDLASLAVAEYHYTGVDPRAEVYVYRTGPKMSHVIVRRGDGSFEDPSLAAGMGKT